jgi:hypothetical protein
MPCVAWLNSSGHIFSKPRKVTLRNFQFKQPNTGRVHHNHGRGVKSSAYYSPFISINPEQ